MNSIVKEVFSCIGVFLFALWAYYPTLENKPVYDDYNAVIENADVRTDVTSFFDVLCHDFWGADINDKLSNTQYRPITILSYRIDFERSCRVPWEHTETEQFTNEAAFDVHNLEDDRLEEMPLLPMVTEEIESLKVNGKWPDHTLKASDDTGTILRKIGIRTAIEMNNSKSVKNANIKRNKEKLVFNDESECLRGFRWTDILLHAGASMLVYMVSRTIADLSWIPALAAGLLFAVHPVHIESVATLYGRADVLCSILQMLALLLANAAAYFISGKALEHLNDDKKHVTDIVNSPITFITCFVAFILAILSTLAKEIGIATFVMIPLVFWHRTYTIASTAPALKKKHPSLCYPSVLLSTCGIASALLFVALRRNLIHSWGPPMSWFDNPLFFLPKTFLSKALTLGHLHARYLLWLIYPIYSSPNYGYNSVPIIDSIANVYNLGTLAAYTTIFGSLVLFSVKGAWTHLLILCWGGGTFLPSTNILFPVGTAFAERLLYIPSIAFCIIMAQLISSTIASSSSLTASMDEDKEDEKSKEDMKMPEKRKIYRIDDAEGNKKTKPARKSIQDRTEIPGIVIAAMCALVATCLFVTRVRLEDWKSSDLLWKSVVEQLPDNVVGHNNYAVQMKYWGMEREVLHELEEVERIYSESKYVEVKDHAFLDQIKNVKNRTLSIIRGMDSMKSMSLNEITRNTNEIIEWLKSNPSLKTANIGFIHFSALCISGTFADHPQMEDLVVDSFIKVSASLDFKDDATNLIKNVVLPRRMQLHGIVNSKNLIRMLKEL